MRLLRDRILVEPIVEQQTKSGLILPDSASKRNLGKVIIIGDKVRSIKVGETVQYQENGTIELNYLGKDCLIMTEENHVIAVI